jgi:hypothetical protein
VGGKAEVNPLREALMRIWQIVLTVVLGLAVAGCRSDPSKDLLERDNWNKEQEIYRLRSRVEQLQAALNQPGERQIPKTYPGQSYPAQAPSQAGSAGNPSPRYTEPDRPNSEPEIPLPGGLNISPGTESPPGEVPERMRVPDSGAPGGRQDHPATRPAAPVGTTTGVGPQWKPSGDDRAGGSAETGSSAVYQITLHPALTGGIGTSGQVGDQGLLVVVEPRDLAGNIVNVPGEINVALIDPALSGEPARLARWDFTAAQTQRLIHTGPEPGIHLRLPWISTPAHDRLKVHVRYTTQDGRKLQVERLIGVALNDSPPLKHEMPVNRDPPAQSAARPQWSPVR